MALRLAYALHCLLDDVHRLLQLSHGAVQLTSTDLKSCDSVQLCRGRHQVLERLAQVVVRCRLAPLPAALFFLRPPGRARKCSKLSKGLRALRSWESLRREKAGESWRAPPRAGEGRREPARAGGFR